MKNYEHKLLTRVFGKAGLDMVTSAMCRQQQRFGLDVQLSALVHNFNNIPLSGIGSRAEKAMNSGHIANAFTLAVIWMKL